MSDRQRIGELDRHFFRELSQLRDKRAGIDDIAITPLVDAWYAFLEWAGRASLNDEHLGIAAASGAAAAEQLGIYSHSTGDAARAALLTMRGYLDSCLALFDKFEAQGKDHPNIEVMRRKIARANTDSEQALGVMVYVTEQIAKVDESARGAEEALRATEKLAEAAETAVGLAQKAATEASTSKLEAEFESTAMKNYRAAFGFRVATIAVLGLVIGLAVTFILTHAPLQAETVDWYGIVYRVAVLSALGALAAYLGRQAGDYTRLATWAHGIQIQLKAFLGFVNEIEDGEARRTMFTLFGKRVLESPPDGKSSADDGPTNLIQPIFEQAAKIRLPE